MFFKTVAIDSTLRNDHTTFQSIFVLENVEKRFFTKIAIMATVGFVGQKSDLGCQNVEFSKTFFRFLTIYGEPLAV